MLRRSPAACIVVAVVAAAGVAPEGAAASGRDRPEATATAARLGEASAIRLDGKLTEQAWAGAPAITGFLQREPAEGEAATFDTEVRVAYDAAAIYVAVRAFDREPEKIVGLLTRRDTDSPSDWIRVLIDSYHDRRSAYEFAVNPAGVKQDRYWFNDGDSDASWDAVWDVRVGQDAQGWQAEFRIPFSQLRFDPTAHDTFGFAVVRQIGRLNETSTWPLLPRGANGYVSSFGDLGGLTLGGSAKRLELVPYLVSQVATQPAAPGNPLVKATDPGAALGADLKFALTPALTVTATLNPDFGQVEADPAVVNLTAFETFFAERRPFFVEGAGIFRFNLDCNDGQCTGLFYSRRIGRQPRGEPVVPDGGHAVTPEQTTILGAAKLSGRIGGFSVGALNAVTAEEQAQIAAPGSRRRQVVEPLTRYSVVRARREFGNQSSLGFMVTGADRALTDAVRFLPDAAYTGGVDWDWRLSGARYSLTGYWAGSTVRGSPDAIGRLQRSNVHLYQRPDAGHVELDETRTSLNGQAAWVGFSKIAGDKVRFNTNAGVKSPGFDINDLGFLTRADQVTFSNWLQLRRDKPTKRLRTVRINFNQWSGWNLDGDRLFSGGNINAHATFTNNWSTGGGLNLNARGFADRLTRGGPGGLRNGSLGGWAYVESDDRRPVSFGYGMYAMNDGHGSWVYDGHPSLTVRPTSALSLSSGVRLSRNVDDAQWIEKVTADGDHFVFGRLNQTTVALTTRVNYTVTPDLSFQIYAEPFVSAGDYTEFKELVAGRAPRHEDRYAPFAYAKNPDFNYRSFRTTNVLRWEYQPGSTLFVVWQQAREGRIARGDFRLGRDFGQIFDAPARNVFLVKLAYWFNF